MLSILRQPYPKNNDWIPCLGSAVLFGGFIFLFLLIFRPFGINELQNRQQVLILVGYGLITGMTIFLYQLVLPLLFSRHFDETNWTVLKEILHTLVIIVIIGVGNFFYSYRLGFFDLSVDSFLQLQLITLGVAVIPVSLMVMVRQIQLLRKNLQAAAELTHQIHQVLPPPDKADPEDILLVSDNDKSRFSAATHCVYYVAAADNYIEIVYKDQQEIKKELLRCSLRRAEQQLQANHSFYRCHRTYIVNLKMVKSVTGNAQGYKLLFDQPELFVPVSRNLNREITHLLAGVKK